MKFSVTQIHKAQHKPLFSKT